MVHFIDTPGIGDVRGIHKDKENFDNILDFLLKYENINGVCVLLKRNNSRLTVAFYVPGDTMTVLEKLLSDYNVGINLDNTKYFCFDNGAF